MHADPSHSLLTGALALHSHQRASTVYTRKDCQAVQRVTLLPIDPIRLDARYHDHPDHLHDRTCPSSSSSSSSSSSPSPLAIVLRAHLASFLWNGTPQALYWATNLNNDPGRFFIFLLVYLLCVIMMMHYTLALGYVVLAYYWPILPMPSHQEHGGIIDEQCRVPDRGGSHGLVVDSL